MIYYLPSKRSRQKASFILIYMNVLRFSGVYIFSSKEIFKLITKTKVFEIKKPLQVLFIYTILIYA